MVDVLPPVTVIIATRDRLELLRGALASIWEQDYSGDIDVVCVFDGPVPPGHDLDTPTPPSGQARRTLRVEPSARSTGLSGARNHGLDLVDTDLVAVCDDDDRWHRDKLRHQVARAMRQPEAVCIGGGIRVLSGDKVVVRPAPVFTVGLSDLLRDRVMELHPSTWLLRTASVRAIGGWDEDIPGGYAEDYDLLLRLARIGPIVLVDRIVADILWAGQSHYFGRWQMIAEALEYLLAKFPEFSQEPRGRARISGQIAFALSASGRYADARVRIRDSRRDNRWEPRAILARIVAGRPHRAEVIQRRLHAHGRGI